MSKDSNEIAWFTEEDTGMQKAISLAHENFYQFEAE